MENTSPKSGQNKPLVREREREREQGKGEKMTSRMTWLAMTNPFSSILQVKTKEISS